MIDRYDFATAITMFARYRDKSLQERLRNGNVLTLSDSSLGYRGDDSPADERSELSSADVEVAMMYLGLVAKHCGEDTAIKLACDINRINRVDGVEIILETSDDDPFQTTAHIHDELASEWCDAHGSLDGGTWEECDGPEFCYDIINWYPGQIDALQKEGYDFNFSQYVEPDEEQIAVGDHLSSCESCDYDYSKGEEHVKKRYLASFIGCTRGAIGIHYRIGTSVDATSPENALYKLYEAYDHIQSLILTDANGVKSKCPEKVSAT